MKLPHKETKMILSRMLHAKRIPIAHFSIYGSRFSHQMTDLTVIENEYPQYPPIVDMSPEGQNKHFRGVWYDSIKTLPTVEQKLYEMAIQQKLDHKTYTLSLAPPMYNAMNFYKYITRTHIINDMPVQFRNMNLDKELVDIRDTLCETLLDHYCNIWRREKFKNLHDYLDGRNAGSALANSLILQCYKKLALRNEYVYNSTIQQNPRIWSFWYHGGYGSVEDDVNERNLCFQFEDFGALAIRTKQPLQPIFDRNHELCSTPEVLDYNFHPDMFQIPFETSSKVACIPSYWCGDPCEYPFLLVLTPDVFKSLTDKLHYYKESNIESGAAVICSFAWLSAVATYQGFTPFHDITYPLVCQTIITNGQDWKFFMYQLNTYAFHNDVDQKNKRNLCWSSGKLRLFDTIEDGQVKGINDEVFKMLLKFLHNVPQDRKNVVMKPYLGNETRETDEIINTRYLLRRMYTRVPNKMDHRNEVPTWVKIYKLHPDAPPSPFVRLE